MVSIKLWISSHLECIFRNAPWLQVANTSGFEAHPIVELLSRRKAARVLSNEMLEQAAVVALGAQRENLVEWRQRYSTFSLWLRLIFSQSLSQS